MSTPPGSLFHGSRSWYDRCFCVGIYLHVVLMTMDQRRRRNPSAASQVPPYLLLQVILAYERNSAQDNYTAFVVIMKATTVHFAKASCSVSYIHDLIGHRTPRTPFELVYSQPYDLLQQEDRRAFITVYYGLLQCLYARLRIYGVES